MRILIVGLGDIGSRVAELVRGRIRVLGLSRSPQGSDTARRLGVMPVDGDLDDLRRLRRFAGLADTILHFAPPPSEGIHDSRTRHLLAALSRPLHHTTRGRRSLPRRLVYISTTGVYGDCDGDWVSETRPARPRNARARRRADAEGQLRRWAARGGVCLTLLRAPGIYAQDRLPSERVRRGLPTLRPEDDVWTNHIHADDLARLAVCAVFRGYPNRLYNAVDQSGLRMGEWFDVVADHLGLPRPPRLPRSEVMAAVTPAMQTFLTESRRIRNDRVRNEFRFRWRYPTVQAGLAELK